VHGAAFAAEGKREIHLAVLLLRVVEEALE